MNSKHYFLVMSNTPDDYKRKYYMCASYYELEIILAFQTQNVKLTTYKCCTPPALSCIILCIQVQNT